jgi:hypothetical protein
MSYYQNIAVSENFHLENFINHKGVTFHMPLNPLNFFSLFRMNQRGRAGWGFKTLLLGIDFIFIVLLVYLATSVDGFNFGTIQLLLLLLAVLMLGGGFAIGINAA